MSYTAVLFDLDGTLVDSYAALTNAVNAARAASELAPLDVAFIRECTGEGVEVLLQKTFGAGDFPDTYRRRFEESYDEICAEQSVLLDDVEATLEKLAESGVAMAVCTNKPTPFSERILAHLGVARYFAAIVGPDRAGARKPDPHHVLFTLQQLALPREQALFVGDMPIDVLAARESGLSVAVIATGSSPIEALRAAKPDFLLDRFSELVPIVRGER